jgi:hypothetical protein
VTSVLVDLGAVPVGQAVAMVRAQEREPPPGKGDEFGKASPVGLVVIVLLFLATILLVRSMTKHLRKVPASFDRPVASGAAPAGPDPSADVAPGPAPATGDVPAEKPARD